MYFPPALIKVNAPLKISSRMIENMNAIISRATDGLMFDGAQDESVADVLGLRIVPQKSHHSVPLYHIAFGRQSSVWVSVAPEDCRSMIRHFNNLSLDERSVRDRCDPDVFFRSRCGAIEINEATSVLTREGKGSDVTQIMQGHYRKLMSQSGKPALEVELHGLTLRLYANSVMTAVHNDVVIGGYLNGNFMIRPEYRGKGLGAIASAAKTFMPIANNHDLAVSSGQYSEAGFRAKAAALRLLRAHLGMEPVSEKVISDLHSEGVSYHQKIDRVWRVERVERRSHAPSP